jgi:hypothetical protein
MTDAGSEKELEESDEVRFMIRNVQEEKQHEGR